jgi:hypothetical protein
MENRTVLSSMDIVIHLLCSDPKGGELVLVEGASEIIAGLLDAIFGLDDPTVELDSLIGLSCALEVELQSLTAAGHLRAMLCADARFVAALGPGEEWKGFAANPELARWSGGEEVKSAPMQDALQPAGTIKAGSFVSVVPPHVAKAKAKAKAARRATAG